MWCNALVKGYSRWTFDIFPKSILKFHSRVIHNV
jgi:hypothetical protein